MNSNRVWGGGEKWHYETADYLSDLGYDVMVITNRQSHLFQKIKVHPKIKVHAYRISNYSFLNPFKLFALRRLLKAQGVETIILGLSNDVKAGGFAAKLAGVKYIIYRRGTALPVKNSLLNRYLFGHVLTKVIANSEEIKNTIFDRNSCLIKPERVRIIYNGIKLNNSESRPAIKSHDDEIIIGNAGRLVEQKDHESLIGIAAILKQRQLKFKVHIAGSGELESALKRLCKQEGLLDQVIFMDFVEDMSAYLNEIDIYCSTSKHEGSSHVILEAMAAKKPLIAFNVSTFPEMIKDGENGFLVPYKEIAIYADKIQEIQRDRDKLYKMGQASRNLVEKQFDFSNKAREFLELIESEGV